MGNYIGFQLRGSGSIAEHLQAHPGLGGDGGCGWVQGGGAG